MNSFEFTSLVTFVCVFLFFAGFKRFLEIYHDKSPLRARAMAAEAEAARLRKLIDDWNKAQNTQDRAKMQAHTKKYTPDYWKDLGIEPTHDKRAILRAFRARVKKAHPDHGGSAYAFQKLFEAKNQALAQSK